MIGKHCIFLRNNPNDPEGDPLRWPGIIAAVGFHPHASSREDVHLPSGTFRVLVQDAITGELRNEPIDVLTIVEEQPITPNDARGSWPGVFVTAKRHHEAAERKLTQAQEEARRPIAKRFE